jgi:uncharacterized membrane protein HdeD (DUF308 family)
MKKSNYGNLIIILTLILTAVLSALFVSNPDIKAGMACLCFGIAAMFGGWLVVNKSKQELEEFDASSKEILLDIAQKQEDSEYFGSFSIETSEKFRNKLIKRNRKQVSGCLILGFILIVTSIICFV